MAYPRIEIEMFPASYGDCFLIRCRKGGDTTNVLIDGGLHTTYSDFLRPRLLELAAAGEDIALLVVSHIDIDHIEGVLAFLAENGRSDEPSIISVREIWHNSYRHLNLQGREPTRDEIRKVQTQVVNPSLKKELEKEIAAKHGSALAALIKKYGYKWNERVANAAITTEAGCLEIHPGVQLTVLSPGPAQLAALAQLWRRELLRLGVSHEAVESLELEEAFELQLLQLLDLEPKKEKVVSSARLTIPPPESFEEDRATPNGSSIAFALEFGSYRIAMLADAFPSVVLATLENSESLPLQFDLIKVSHHGSRRSTSPALLDALESPNFLISTDGTRHQHPHLDTLLRILGSQRGCQLVFNYPVPAAQQLDEDAAKKKFAHSLRVGSGHEPIQIPLV